MLVPVQLTDCGEEMTLLCQHTCGRPCSMRDAVPVQHTNNLLLCTHGVFQGAPAPCGRRGKRGGGGGSRQQGYPPQSPYSPQPHSQQASPYQQGYQQQYQQQSVAQSSVLLQPLLLQPPQLLQPGLMSPAAAAAYYGSPSPMQQMQHSPASPMLDPNAMALLFGGMTMAGPMSPGDSSGVLAAGMVAGQYPGYGMGMHSPTIGVPAAGMHAAGMLSPMGGMLSPVPQAAAVGVQSLLPQPLMHPATTLHSPY
jgi:hypothetical protein